MITTGTVGDSWVAAAASATFSNTSTTTTALTATPSNYYVHNYSWVATTASGWRHRLARVNTETVAIAPSSAITSDITPKIGSCMTAFNSDLSFTR